MRLLTMEIRRALRRRAVWALVALALLGCAIGGMAAFFSSQGMTLAELRLGDGHPALMIDWWDGHTSEGFLGLAMFFLVLGGFFGGATVAGAEWRAGTVTTLLTWEPRRLRLHAARTASAGLLAFLISAALQIVFLASFLPAVLAHGTTAGADGAFWADLGVVVLRTSLITATAAVLAVGMATAARNTAFAVIALFAWVAVIEGLLRALRPSVAPWLWGENLATVMTWRQLPDVEFARSPLVALLTLVVYCSVIVAGATASFRSRDIAAAT